MDNRVKEIVDRSRRIVFFGGAGVSTESNIPDFRSETGLYKAMNEYGHSPEDMLSSSFFYQDARPNKAHIALAKMEEEGKLTAVVTQNIDGLHQKAGSRKVYELHGSVLRNTCMECGERYDLEYIMDEANCENKVPRCEKCGAVVKPDVVLYGEMLDEDVLTGAVKAISEADTLIVGGTSLVVYPAAGLINYFSGKDLILINKSETSYDGRATLVINDAIGKVLGD